MFRKTATSAIEATQKKELRGAFETIAQYKLSNYVAKSDNPSFALQSNTSLRDNNQVDGLANGEIINGKLRCSKKFDRNRNTTTFSCNIHHL
jgi:hypothetical protein